MKHTYERTAELVSKFHGVPEHTCSVLTNLPVAHLDQTIVIHFGIVHWCQPSNYYNTSYCYIFLVEILKFAYDLFLYLIIVMTP
jgi:hypothetical protein